MRELVIELLLLVITLAVSYATVVIRQRFKQDEIERALRVARIVVDAVEQIAAQYPGKVRLAQALVHARRIGERAGVRLTDDEWRILIEHAVRELKRAEQEVRGVPGGRGEGGVVPD